MWAGPFPLRAGLRREVLPFHLFFSRRLSTKGAAATAFPIRLLRSIPIQSRKTQLQLTKKNSGPNFERLDDISSSLECGTFGSVGRSPEFLLPLFRKEPERRPKYATEAVFGPGALGPATVGPERRARRRCSRIQQVGEVKPIFDTDNQMLFHVSRPRELSFPGSPGIYADDEAIFTEPLNPTCSDRKCVLQPSPIFTSTRREVRKRKGFSVILLWWEMKELRHFLFPDFSLPPVLRLRSHSSASRFETFVSRFCPDLAE